MDGYSPVIEVFVTNLGKYAGGDPCGEWLTLPTTTEDVQKLLARIGVDGVRYEEISITDYETTVPGLCDKLGEHENLDELNYLAEQLSELSHPLLGDSLIVQFTAAVEHSGASSAKDLINIIRNLDDYIHHPDVDDYEALGLYLVNECCALDIPDNIEPYFDYEAYGESCAINAGGRFTSKGYVERGQCDIAERYSGRDDIPDEYRVFAYPPLEKSIKKTLASYTQEADETPAADQHHTQPDYADR